MAKYGTLTKQQADRFKIFLPEFEVCKQQAIQETSNVRVFVIVVI